MKFLFVNAYFMPEKVAFSHLEKDLIEAIVEEGNEIEIICPVPTRGITAEEKGKYKSLKNESLYDGKVTVTRFWAPDEGKNPLLRAFRYLWCNLREYMIGKKMKGVDCIFAASTPPTQGLLAGLLSKKLSCPFIYSLQDIFPDSLVTTGLSRENSLLYKIGKVIERKTYSYADKIIVISPSCKRNLLNKGINENKLHLISNWVDAQSTVPVENENNALFDEFNISKTTFNVVYAGNLGVAQGADIILDAAEELKNDDNIRFVIFGGGAEFENTVKDIKKRKLTNILINPLLPQEKVSQVYSLGDVCLVTCKAGVGNSGLPSKVWSIMACNTPIIASFDTESDLAEILSSSGAGVTVEAGNSSALAREIKKASQNGKKKTNSRDYVLLNADKKLCVKKYIELAYNTRKEARK